MKKLLLVLIVLVSSGCKAQTTPDDVQVHFNKFKPYHIQTADMIIEKGICEALENNKYKCYDKISSSISVGYIYVDKSLILELKDE